MNFRSPLSLKLSKYRIYSMMHKLLKSGSALEKMKLMLNSKPFKLKHLKKV